MKTSLVLLAALSLGVACSKKDSNMAVKRINELDEKTSVIYDKLVSKDAEGIRNKKFEILHSKDEKLGSKIAAAAVYFQSLEFQTAQKTKKQILLLNDANEFTQRIGDIYAELNLRRMSPMRDGKKHSEEQSFYALAITVHLTNQYENELLDNTAGLKAISFYDVIRGALKKDSNGDPMQEHEEVLVSNINREIMIELIKARVDMFSALALKNLTDKRNMTLKQKLKSGLFSLSNGKYGAIELPEVFAKSNEPTKKQTIQYLEAASKAKKFLNDLGVEKDLEKSLKSAFTKISLGDEAEETRQQEQETKEETDARKVQIKELIQSLL